MGKEQSLFYVYTDVYPPVQLCFLFWDFRAFKQVLGGLHFVYSGGWKGLEEFDQDAELGWSRKVQ